MLKPIPTFSAMSGWTKEAKSGQLKNVSDSKAEFIEYTIPFMVK
jgi:hypothetical protein